MIKRHSGVDRRRSSALACLAGLAAILIAACGGTGGAGVRPDSTGEVTGVIVDETGALVRDARVFYDGRSGGTRVETRSNSTGAFELARVPSRSDGFDLLIKAEASVLGAWSVGQNLVRVFSGERSKSVTVVLYREDRLATLRGTIRDREGFRLRGVRVFARPADGGVQASAVGISDSNGNYEIRLLGGGVSYNLQANARGYDTDFVNGIVLAVGETRQVDFRLGPGGDPALPAPQNLIATAWTSPFVATRDARQRQAFESLKSHLRPRKGPISTRTADNGWPIEVDLQWDEFALDSHLGFGIYRGTSDLNLRDIDFLRDPQAVFYADQDRILAEGAFYSYRITALNTDFGDGFGESPFSNLAEAETLGPVDHFFFRSAFAEFEWRPARGAEDYVLYVFEEFPTVIDRILHTSPSIIGTSYRYNGPALRPGREYFAIVVGRANNGGSFSVSEVISFRP